MIRSGVLSKILMIIPFSTNQYKGTTKIWTLLNCEKRFGPLNHLLMEKQPF
jgi:hypothetical protein